jgi:hypothetical protein
VYALKNTDVMVSVVAVNVLGNVVIGLFVCCGLADWHGFGRGREGDVEMLVVHMQQVDHPMLTCQIGRVKNVVSLVCSLLSTILKYVCQFHCHVH